MLLAYKTRTEIFSNNEQKYTVFCISQTPDAAPVKHGGGVIIWAFKKNVLVIMQSGISNVGPATGE